MVHNYMLISQVSKSYVSRKCQKGCPYTCIIFMAIRGIHTTNKNFV